MDQKLKAREILEKINNGKISEALWKNCSEYAKKDLKRKANIVVDEIILELKTVEFNYDLDFSENLFPYWKQVKKEIKFF